MLLEPHKRFGLKVLSKAGQIEGRALNLICMIFTFFHVAGAFTRSDLQQSETGVNVQSGLKTVCFKEGNQIIYIYIF